MDREEIRKEWEKGNLIAPAADILETKDQYKVRAQMPGVKKGAVNVSIEDGELLIFGRVDRSEDECDCRLLNEIDSGNFYRAFKVGDGVETKQVKAKMEDGMLEVTLPKHERMKPRVIPIES
jgi:HSP20 family protein